MRNYSINGWRITLGPFNLILSDPSGIIAFKLQFDDETSANSTNLENSESSFTYSEDQDALGSSNVQTTLGTMLTSKYKLMFYIDSSRENANVSNDPSSSSELQGTGHIELMEADGMNWILHANNVPLNVIDVLFKIGKEEFDSIDIQYNLDQGQREPSGSMGGGRRKRSRKTRRRVRRN